MLLLISNHVNKNLTKNWLEAKTCNQPKNVFMLNKFWILYFKHHNIIAMMVIKN